MPETVAIRSVAVGFDFYEKSEKKINTDSKTILNIANEIIKSLG